jgi:hypothetical protein
VNGGVMVFFRGGCRPARLSGRDIGRGERHAPANQRGGADRPGRQAGEVAPVFAIRSDAAYANLHTGSFPAGEIRGQITD